MLIFGSSHKLLGRAALCLLILSNANFTWAKSNKSKKPKKNIAFTMQAYLASDSNPYRLNSQLSARDYSTPNTAKVSVQYTGDTFAQSSLKLELGKHKPIFASAYYSRNSYSESKDADSNVMQLKLGAKKYFSDKKHRVRFTYSYKSFDKTYVSRLDGVVFDLNADNDVNGNYVVDATGRILVGDRYDYTQSSPKLSLSFGLAKKNRLLFEVENLTKDYEDFSDLSLDNLDYQQLRVKAQWATAFNKKWNASLFVETASRDFDRAYTQSVQQREEVVVDKLNFQYFGYGAKSNFKLSQRQRLSVEFMFSKREDNAIGYYDTETNEFDIVYSYRMNKKGKFKVSASYLDLEYTRGGGQDVAVNDETPSTDGWKYALSFNKPMSSIRKATLHWRSSLSYYDYSSADPIYSYRRTTFKSGIAISF